MGITSSQKVEGDKLKVFVLAFGMTDLPKKPFLPAPCIEQKRTTVYLSAGIVSHGGVLGICRVCS